MERDYFKYYEQPDSAVDAVITEETEQPEAAVASVEATTAAGRGPMPFVKSFFPNLELDDILLIGLILILMQGENIDDGIIVILIILLVSGMLDKDKKKHT